MKMLKNNSNFLKIKQSQKHFPNMGNIFQNKYKQTQYLICIRKHKNIYNQNYGNLIEFRKCQNDINKYEKYNSIQNIVNEIDVNIKDIDH